MSVEAEAAAPPPTEAAIIASMGADAEEREVTAPVDAQGDEVVTETAEPEAEQTLEPDPNDEPPEFWSAEKKEIFRTLTPEAKAAVREHYEEATRSTNRKIEEAALARKAAEDAARQHQANQEQLASWWQVNGQRIGQMVAGKWAGVDWNDLAANNPGEWARLRQQYESEMGQVREMQTRHEAEVKAVEQRREVAHRQERAAEHEKLAKKFPKEFGTPEVAQKTYDSLSKFLLDRGVAPDRLSGIYEEAVVSIVKDAYDMAQIRAKAKGLTNPAQTAQPASTTPRRVTPGAARPANQGSDTERQALERLRRGESSEEIERWAFR
jgi:hypothetical protein